MNKRWLKVEFNIIAFIFFVWLASPNECSALVGKIQENKNPRLANYYLKWSLSDAETEKLAKWDLLILDMEVQENSRSNLIKLRQLNPNIIILAYITSEEIRSDIINNRDAKLRRILFNEIRENWWLNDNLSNRLSSWPNTWLINLTNQAPASDGERWNTILPKFVKNNILSSGLWDGVFYDNIWHDISWINKGIIDINNDGSIESSAEINSQWIDGVMTMLKNSQLLFGDDFVIMTNGSSYDRYQPYSNGIMFENFPTPWEKSGRWQEVLQSYFRVKELNKKPHLSVINSSSKNEKDYLKMRNGLASSLLTDAYFSFDYDMTDHGQTWWYDEYDYYLGAPLNEAYRTDGPGVDYPQGIWRRDFANGSVYLNSYYQEKIVVLPNRFRKLSGSQDNIVNDGGLVSYLVLGPGDGILLKNIFEIYNLGLLNNVNYEIYSHDLKKIRNYSFFNKYYKNLSRLALDKNGEAKSTAKNISADVNGDKKSEKIYDANFGKESNINIIDAARNKLIGSFPAYNKEFRCGLRVAVADIDNDGLAEIITVPAYGGPHLKIFDHKGRLKGEIFFNSKNLRANYDVAVADVNNDNLMEILIGIYN